MSRIANSPVEVPAGVELKVNGQLVSIKGSQGTLEHKVHQAVEISFEDSIFRVKGREGQNNAVAHAGTARSLINNMVIGVTKGFEKKLKLLGVGYRAKVQGKVLNLTLGFSHPVNYDIPEGVTIDTPSNTEITVKGANKQLVGQVAADIRAYRPPEPYKGKGVRYTDEYVRRKEAKKK
ncbi:MAG TPA: 50S ribosomal protein L6 [Aeromonadales bacterium]|nr:50S ribosomal protein L6 [Aeromonadales bacterium]